MGWWKKPGGGYTGDLPSCWRAFPALWPLGKKIVELHLTSKNIRGLEIPSIESWVAALRYGHLEWLHTSGRMGRVVEARSSGFVIGSGWWWWWW